MGGLPFCFSGGMDMKVTELVEKMDQENEELTKAVKLLQKKNRYLMEQLQKHCNRREFDHIWDVMECNVFGGDG